MSPWTTVGPWALLGVSVVVFASALRLVRLVLDKCVAAAGDRDVSVKVRLLRWLRVEIDIKTPQHVVAQTQSSQSGKAPPAEVVPLRDDVRESG